MCSDQLLLTFYFRLIELSNLSPVSYSKDTSSIMSSRTITKQHTRSSSTVDRIDPAELDTLIKTNRAKSSADRKVRLEERKRQSAMSLGAVAWDDMFESDDLKLPDTSFMNHLKQAVPCEQFQQITDGMLKNNEL